jgi:DNA-binding transcriptional MocR family regulator
MLFDQPVKSVPWRDGGLDLDALRAAAGPRPLAYVCPDFHNPTGWTLSEADRSSLAAWARENDGAVLDDAIFRDMRFEGTEPPSLYGLLPPGRRFLAGSVSKSFMTGLRVGYLVADAPVIGELLLTKRYLDLGCPTVSQAIAASFLVDGYEEHLERMRRRYRERRDAALAALERHMPDGTTWTRPEGGFQLWVTLPEGVSAVELFLRGVERGVAVSPGPAHDVDGRYASSFRLGFAAASPDHVRRGVQRLAEVVRTLLSRGPRDHAGPGLAV